MWRKWAASLSNLAPERIPFPSLQAGKGKLNHLYEARWKCILVLFPRRKNKLLFQVKGGPDGMFAAAAAAKSLQSCPTLCDPIDGLPPGSPVPGILQARTLEWVPISFSNAGKWKAKVKSLSHVRLFATPWTVAYQAPPSTGFSRQEYWSGFPFPSPMHESEKWKWSQNENTWRDAMFHLHSGKQILNC